MRSYLQTLNILCDSEDPRTHVNTPWHENGYSYSTNGYCCLRIPGEFGEPHGHIYPKVCDFNWHALNDESSITYISASKIRSISSDCRHCRVDISEPIRGACPECGGFGEIKCSCCESDIECESCDGYGITTTEIPRRNCDECLGTGVRMSRYAMGHQAFSTTMLLLLLENLPNLRFLIGAEVVKDAIGFRFGTDGMGLLMRIR